MAASKSAKNKKNRMPRMKIRSKPGFSASSGSKRRTSYSFLVILRGVFLVVCVIANFLLLGVVHGSTISEPNISEADPELEYINGYLIVMWIFNVYVATKTIQRVNSAFTHMAGMAENQISEEETQLLLHSIIGVLGLVEIYFSSYAIQTGSSFHVHGFLFAQLAFVTVVARAALSFEEGILYGAIEHGVQGQYEGATWDLELMASNKTKKRARAPEPIPIYY